MKWYFIAQNKKNVSQKVSHYSCDMEKSSMKIEQHKKRYFCYWRKSLTWKLIFNLKVKPYIYTLYAYFYLKFSIPIDAERFFCENILFLFAYLWILPLKFLYASIYYLSYLLPSASYSSGQWRVNKFHTCKIFSFRFRKKICILLFWYK